MSSTPAASTATPASTSAPVVEAIEEDDEFEEFTPANWDTAENDKDDAQHWQDNWDDDDIEDEFTATLRAELESSAMK
ncbi:hypothetical protein TrCOL_g7496 [Triparma columacea]|uniref:Uncharacterized protein n=1 Tax=Triparma columacea TaxID=722753 RepID=A0A9W7G2C3_9STRA|nr:hypothetical protein TrCOL_g7496 [Triparma columacea]